MQENNGRNNHKTERHIRYALVAAICLLVFLAILAIAQYQALQRQQFFQARISWYSWLLSRHAPIPLGDAGAIRQWMTFDYVNKLFALPATYLKIQLSITDARYPRLTIGTYANAVHLNQAAFLGQVENAIRSYPAPHATSTKPSAATGTTPI